MEKNYFFPRICFQISKCPLLFKSSDFRSDIMFLKCVWHERDPGTNTFSERQRNLALPNHRRQYLAARTTLRLRGLLTQNANRAHEKEFKFAVYQFLIFFLPIVNSGFGLLFTFCQSIQRRERILLRAYLYPQPSSVPVAVN